MKLLPLLLAVFTCASAEEPPPYEDLLQKNGFVILDETYKQGFEPYTDSRQPVFITTDCLLMAFHRLMEQYLFQIDAAQMEKDREGIPFLWNNLPAEPDPEIENAEEGLRLARLAVATAHRLLFGIAPDGLTEEETRLVAKEAKRVEEANGGTLPSWLNSDHYPPDLVVSYAIYQPVGPWSGNIVFENYFRFRKWMQETPLAKKEPGHKSLLDYLKKSLHARKEPRESAEKMGVDGPPSNSSRFGNLIHDMQADTSVFYLRYPEVDADHSLIVELIENEQARLVPLAIAAATGNRFARSHLQESVQIELKISNKDDPCYQLLKSLSARPDERAPDLFHSEAWGRKLANTACGSWAEWKYGRQLNIKEAAGVLAPLGGSFPGFVEPAPEFYRHLSKLCEVMGRELTSNEKPLNSDVSSIRWLQDVIVLVKRWGPPTEKFPVEILYAKKKQLIDALLAYLAPSLGMSDDIEALSNQEAIKFLEGTLEKFARNDKEVVRIFRSFPISNETSIDDRFWQLALLVSRVELLCDRQLSGQEWTDRNHQDFEDFGDSLAKVMFYELAFQGLLRDDSPRIARYGVGVLPGVGSTIYHAAIARPRKLIVRYPMADGGHIDCVGSVYAFRQVTAERTPTNAEWVEKCRESEWPEWMAPIVADGE